MGWPEAGGTWVAGWWVSLIVAEFRGGKRMAREHIRRMERERYVARRIQHCHIVRIGDDGQETIMEITDSEEAAKAEAARLDREAERRTNDKPS
jgi:hypothetical protein